MAGGKDIKRLPKPTKALALNPEDCVCCTPSMAGTVLARLSRSGGIRRGSGSRRTPPQRVRELRPSKSTSTVVPPPSPTGAETIEKVALRAGLYALKATWKPKQTSPDAVFFDLGTGELVGHASTREMFEEARRLGAKRSADRALVRWTPPVEWFPSLRRRETEAKFWRAIDNTWPYHYAAVQLEDGGRRSPGKTVRVDVLAQAGFSDHDREVLRGLGQDAELQAARGLFVGLSHPDAMTLGFVGALSSEGLTRAQAYAALRWAPADRSVFPSPKAPASVAKRDAPAKPKKPPRRKAPRAKPVASPQPSGSAVRDDGPPVRMDVVLRDLKDAAEAKGQSVERKHVAKAVRAMLNARQLGLSVTTPNHSFASTLDVRAKGSRFTAAQDAALRALFGEGSSQSNSFMVLVTRFIGNADSVPTGIVPSRIEAFRRRVAAAAGLEAPGPFDPAAKRTMPAMKSSRSAPTKPNTPTATPLRVVTVPDRFPANSATVNERMSDEQIQTLVEAFVEYANYHEEAGSPLHAVSNEHAFLVQTGPVGSGTTVFAVRPSARSFTVSHGSDLSLVELFLGTYALPMRGQETSRTERTRSFAWAPKSEWGTRWNRTMSDFAIPVSLPSDSGSDSKVQTGAAPGIGRADHEERRDNRVPRLRSRADKARGEAEARFNASGQGLPPFGEPIKIGHHSERRHRRAIERAQAQGFKGLEASRDAKRLDARADTAERNTAISSDDPRALDRLKAKLAEMEAEREETKRANRLARQGKLPVAENPLNPASIQHVAGKRKYPMPGYALTNLGAEIRRTRERIETLEKRQGRAARSLKRGGVQVVENGELNRLQIFTGSKPPKENRTWLKINGFRWARSEGAWQRLLGDAAWNAAMLYLDEFVEKRDDTPYARVEATEAKPMHTEKDLAFWRSEFEALDEEFPGEDFDDAMLTEVTEALRARDAGMPSLQAHAYSEYRLGRATLEEAVASMFAYRRHARPKRRPRSPRTPVASSMGREAFLSEVKKRGSKLGGQLFSSRGRGGDIYLHHYNVPKATEDEARRENNRLMLSVSGWERDGGPPKSGNVKLEVLVSARLKDLRGRTTTPEAMVDIVVEMFRRHSALKSV